MEFFQLLANGLVMGCVSGMIALSFSLIYATTGVLHIAHAGVLSLSAYVLWFLLSKVGLGGWIAVPATLAAGALAGAAIQGLLYGPLGRRGAPPLVLMIASLGLLAVMDNLTAAVFSADTLFYPEGWGKRIVSIGSVILTYTQLLMLACGLLMLAAGHWVLKGSDLGRKIRAVAANPLMAEIGRLRPQRVYLVVYAIASAAVSVPGMLLGADVGIRPYTGTTYVLVAAIAMIAAGVGNIPGAFVVAMVLGIFQNAARMWLAGPWSFALTFLLFVALMVVRPRGVFSSAHR
jgi:branched-chain amino acid transport system permease protein